MRRCSLAVIVADLGQADRDLPQVFDKWSDCDLFDSVAIVDVSNAEKGLTAPVVWICSGKEHCTTLQDVITAEAFGMVSLVAVRTGQLGGVQSARHQAEESLRELLEGAFEPIRAVTSAQDDLGATEFRALTVSPSWSDRAISDEHFSPSWDLHVLVDPLLVADSKVAVLPLEAADCAPVCLLTALALVGALRWQDGPLVVLSDRAVGRVKPARIARLQMRAINAGRLVDRARIGVLPEDGPWTIPEGIDAIQAPRGTPIPSYLVAAVAEQAGFSFNAARNDGPDAAPWRRDQEPEAAIEQWSMKWARQHALGAWRALLLFLRHFGSFLSGSSTQLISPVHSQLGLNENPHVQGAAHGASWEDVLGVGQDMDVGELGELVERLRSSGAPETATPVVPEPERWRQLSETVFALADGGELPASVRRPSLNSQRLLYTDPDTIGPPPDDPPYRLTAEQARAVGLEGPIEVAPVDVATARRVDQALRNCPPAVPVAAGAAPEEAAFAENSETTRAGAPDGERQPPTPEAGAPDGERQPPTPEAGAPDGERQPPTPDVESWQQWLSERRNSLLWLLNERLADALTAAHRSINDSLHALAGEARPDDGKSNVKEQEIWRRHRRWLWFNLIVLGVLALAVGRRPIGMLVEVLRRGPDVPWSPLVSLLLLAGVAAVLIVRGAAAARAIQQIQLDRDAVAARRSRWLRRSGDGLSELSRLVASRNQFEDWQAILRSAVHRPFGRTTHPEEPLSSEDIPFRPYSFVYATAQPLDRLSAKIQLSLRSAIFRRGWLSASFSDRKRSWQQDYGRRTGKAEADPAADNSPPGAIHGRVLGSNEPIAGPREDLLAAMSDGSLDEAVHRVKEHEIISCLREMPVDEIISPVSVAKAGRAMTGLAPEVFLRGVNTPLAFVPIFDADLFSPIPDAQHFRLGNVSSVHPADGSICADFGGRGRDAFFASFALYMSEPIPPHYLASHRSIGPGTRGRDEFDDADRPNDGEQVV